MLPRGLPEKNCRGLWRRLTGFTGRVPVVWGGVPTGGGPREVPRGGSLGGGSGEPFLGLWAFSRLLDLDVFPAFSWSLETFSGSFFGPGASSGLLSLFPAFSGPRDLFWAFSELLDLFPTFFWASGLFPAFSGSGGLFWLSGCVLGFLRSS